MDTPPRGTFVRASDVRRPPWSAAVARRRPSGQEPVPTGRDRRLLAVWSAVLVASIVALVLLRVVTEQTSAVQTVDRAVGDLLRGGDLPTLARELDGIADMAEYRVIWVPAAVVLAWFARWRHLVVYLGTVSVVAAAAQVIAGDGAFVRAVRRGVTGSDDAVVVPAWPVIVVSALVAATVLVLAPPGRWRRVAGAAGVLAVVAVAADRVAMSLDSATATVVSAGLGCSTAALAFALFAPEREFPVVYHRQVRAHLRLDAARKGRIVAAVRDQLGIPLRDIDPYRLDGSAGSTPCRLVVADGAPGVLFGKLYATTHLRSDRWYKYVRVLRYGRLEDEAPFSSVRRLVEHEDYMLRLLRDGGVQVPEPGGVVEVVAGREYLLVTELVPDSVEILESGVSDAVIDDALLQIHRLWQAGAAHRDIKPSNVLVQGSRVVLIDVSFGELRPSRWRQAVDLANMMLILALVAGPERVLARAGRLFAAEDLAEAFAATSSLTVPRQLRRLLDAHHRDLPAEFRRSLPAHPRISMQSWSLLRVLLAVGAVVGIVLALLVVGLNLRAGGLL
ncbi:RIO1 family regulatory kinase/ATPase domain-containing protein [Blastococcus tunisiensis]|uniref:non-specific serine/threonine protein kinase n=1 Tax=Blastococcus tunisiensis TaxID=1798228 RepID=A0A1I2E029_9ACTN|nr:RIO1 family regulatory kinase/ATPase [Blastococcus sp. DSM 46838]SFE85911.1 RIO1 family protein [Blastococcus sp. DSM 46838]